MGQPQSDGPVQVLILALVAYTQETVTPAIELAAAESNRIYGPHINFSYEIYLNPHQETCDLFENGITEFVSKFYYTERPRNSYLLILATGCSFAMMSAGELSREWNIPMVASAGSDTKLRNKHRYPTLVCFLPSQIVSYPVTFKKLLNRYNWWTVTFICDPDSSTDFYFRTACKEFQDILRKSGQNFTVTDFVANLSVESNRVRSLKTAKMYSRIIILLAHMDLVRMTLITASRLGITSPDYVFITSLLYNFNTPFWGSPHWFRDDSPELNKVAKAAFESLLIITMAKPRQSPTMKKFLEHIASISRRTYHSESALAEERQIYSICGHTAFRAAAEMVNETLATHRNLTDGAAFVRRMYNRNFASVEGNPFKINDNGDRDSLLAVVAMSADNDTLEEVLFYDAQEDAMYQSPDGYVWLRENMIADDRPACGYSGDDPKCSMNNSRSLTIAVSVPATCLSTLFTLMLLLVVRRQTIKRHAKEASRYLLPAHMIKFDCRRKSSFLRSAFRVTS